MKKISSAHNPLVVAAFKLKQKKYRKQTGLYPVEGIKMAREALLCGQTVQSLFVRESEEQALNDLILLAEARGAEVISLSEEAYGKLSDTVQSQGVIALVKGGFSDFRMPEGSFLVLDRISDPGNLGTIIRTACATGFSELYLIDCVDPFSDKTVRSSMSGIYHVRLMTCTEEEALSLAGEASLYAADMGGENIFRMALPKGKIGFIIGNEANGVSSALLGGATGVCSLPMQEGCESLNAGVAASVLMYRVYAEQINQ